MPQPRPCIQFLLFIAIDLAERLPGRMLKSLSLQHECQNTAANLSKWRKSVPSDMEFLLRSQGDKDLYKAVLLPLSELLCILCQLIWTAHEFGKPASVTTISRTHEVERTIKKASVSTKKYMDDLGVWRKPTKNHAHLAILFDKASRSDKRFLSMEETIAGHMGACYRALADLTGKINRAKARQVGLRLLAGKTT